LADDEQHLHLRSVTGRHDPAQRCSGTLNVIWRAA
jgi:hypothetical protein